MSDSWRFISTIAKKEVIEFVRDWRTLIALIVIPLLIFPALFIALPLLLQSEAAELDAMEFMTLVLLPLPQTKFFSLLIQVYLQQINFLFKQME